MIVYKVVLKHPGFDNQFTSIGKACTSDFELTYHVGETTYPEIGKIFVFKTYADAHAFIQYCMSILHMAELGQYAMLAGEAENVSRISTITEIYLYDVNKGHPFSRDEWYRSNSYNIQMFWNAKKQHKRPKVGCHPAVKNSYVCDSFTPTKEYKELPFWSVIPHENGQGTFLLEAPLNEYGMNMIKALWGEKLTWYKVHIWSIGVFNLIGAKAEKLHVSAKHGESIQFKMWINFDKLERLSEKVYPLNEVPTIVNTASSCDDSISALMKSLTGFGYSKIDFDYTIWPE